jgi:hypothetical protein
MIDVAPWSQLTQVTVTSLWSRERFLVIIDSCTAVEKLYLSLDDGFQEWSDGILQGDRLPVVLAHLKILELAVTDTIGNLHSQHLVLQDVLNAFRAPNLRDLQMILYPPLDRRIFEAFAKPCASSVVKLSLQLFETHSMDEETTHTVLSCLPNVQLLRIGCHSVHESLLRELTISEDRDLLLPHLRSLEIVKTDWSNRRRHQHYFKGLALLEMIESRIRAGLKAVSVCNQWPLDARHLFDLGKLAGRGLDVEIEVSSSYKQVGVANPSLPLTYFSSERRASAPALGKKLSVSPKQLPDRKRPRFFVAYFSSANCQTSCSTLFYDFEWTFKQSSSSTNPFGQEVYK